MVGWLNSVLSRINMRTIAVLLSIVGVSSAAELTPEAKTVYEAYKTNLKARADAVQREAANASSSLEKAKKNAALNKLQARLSEIDKGKIVAESFDEIANRDPINGYQAKIGDVFTITKQEAAELGNKMVMLVYQVHSSRIVGDRFVATVQEIPVHAYSESPIEFGKVYYVSGFHDSTYPVLTPLESR